MTYYRKSCPLWYSVENVCRTAQVINNNMAHARCMLDIEGYKQTLRICNTYCFSTAPMVARPPLSVTYYVHCLSCLRYEQQRRNP